MGRYNQIGTPGIIQEPGGGGGVSCSFEDNRSEGCFKRPCNTVPHLNLSVLQAESAEFGCEASF